MSIKLIAFLIGAAVGGLLGWGFVVKWPELLIAAFIIACAGLVGAICLNNYTLFNWLKKKVS